MNAATAATSHPSATDHDLVTDAAHGAPGAFESLYRRHSQPAWRLAHAVAPTIDGAGTATTDGFVRVLRDVRRGSDGAALQFQSYLLTAVYRAAATGGHGREEQRGHDGAAAADASRLPPEQLLSIAFRQLPERWRAALWLMDVDGLSGTAAGSIIGVSSAAVVQLNKRGHAGLDHRLRQAGSRASVPDLATTLAGVVPPVPPALGAATENKWKRAMASERRRAAPAAGWLIERAPTPLAACAVGICAAGIIGAALMGQGRGGPTDAVPAGQIAAPPAGAIPAPSGALGLGGTAPTTIPASPFTPAATVTPVAASATANPRAIAIATVTTTIPPDVQRTGSVPAPTIPPPTIPPPTIPPPTIPPPTIPPPTIPPPTIPPPTIPPPLTAQPVLQATVSVGPVAQLNVGIGNGSCTGLSVLGINAGCTTPGTGVSLGLTVLGTPLLP